MAKYKFKMGKARREIINRSCSFLWSAVFRLTMSNMSVNVENLFVCNINVNIVNTTMTIVKETVNVKFILLKVKTLKKKLDILTIFVKWFPMWVSFIQYKS